MAARRKKAEQHIPLTPRTFHILLALKDGTQHGYAIMKEAEERSRGKVKIGPGTLYEAIGRLVDGELLMEVSGSANAPDDNRRRRFYKLTALGRKVMLLEADRLAELVAYVRGEGLLPKG